MEEGRTERVYRRFAADTDGNESEKASLQSQRERPPAVAAAAAEIGCLTSV